MPCTILVMSGENHRASNVAASVQIACPNLTFRQQFVRRQNCGGGGLNLVLIQTQTNLLQNYPRISMNTSNKGRLPFCVCSQAVNFHFNLRFLLVKVIQPRGTVVWLHITVLIQLHQVTLRVPDVRSFVLFAVRMLCAPSRAVSYHSESPSRAEILFS